MCQPVSTNPTVPLRILSSSQLVGTDADHLVSFSGALAAWAWCLPRQGNQPRGSERGAQVGHRAVLGGKHRIGASDRHWDNLPWCRNGDGAAPVSLEATAAFQIGTQIGTLQSS